MILCVKYPVSKVVFTQMKNVVIPFIYSYLAWKTWWYNFLGEREKRCITVRLEFYEYDAKEERLNHVSASHVVS